MNSLEENLSRLNNQYQDQVRKCNIKYDELVREYRENQPKSDTLLADALIMGLGRAISVGFYAFWGTSTISCFTNCDDWWNSLSWDEPWVWAHIIIPTVIIIGIAYLISVIILLNEGKVYRRVENSIKELEYERKRELDKLQKDHDADKQQIIAQYNQKRDIYVNQLRNSDNTLKLKEQVSLDFEQVYGMLDKSMHIKDIVFEFGISVNQEGVRILAMQGQSRLHDMGYAYKKMQMKNLENIQICEALAIVMSEEVNFMIRERHKQAVTDVEIRDGILILIEFKEPNMNYRGLEAW